MQISGVFAIVISHTLCIFLLGHRSFQLRTYCNLRALSVEAVEVTFRFIAGGEVTLVIVSLVTRL